MKLVTALSQRLSPQASAILRHALPNAVTILALSFGLTGLIYAANGAITGAIGCVLAAALLDACDGGVARATGAASKFGAELDSLSDVICFGAVPAFILYSWGLSLLGGFGWVVCLSLAAASALRLARFNVMADLPDKPSWATHYFTGVPAPAGAFLGLLPIYAEKAGAFTLGGAATLAAVTVPVVAGLMISTWPTFSAKAISRKALRLLFIPSLVALGAISFGLVFEPWTTLTLCALGYLWTLPLSKWRHEVHRRRMPTCIDDDQP